jgi:hypothetical protein
VRHSKQRFPNGLKIEARDQRATGNFLAGIRFVAEVRPADAPSAIKLSFPINRQKYVIPKLGQLDGRKLSRIGDATDTKAFVEKLFPIYRIGCLQQVHELGCGRAFWHGLAQI